MRNINNEGTNKDVSLTDESIIHEGIKLFRIIATEDFGDVRRGDKGGYVESLSNISGDAWVDDEAMVYGSALIMDQAKVTGKAHVSQNAIVKGEAVVSKYAKVFGNAIVKDNAKIFGWAKILGDSMVCINGQVSQFATVSGKAEVRGLVYGNSILTCRAYVAEHTTIPGLAA